MTIRVESHNIKFYGKPHTVVFHNGHVVEITDQNRRKLCRGHKKFGEIARLAKLGATHHPPRFTPRLHLLILLDPPDLLAT